MSENSDPGKRVKQAFENQQLDQKTREDLRRARQHALDTAARKAVPRWLPAAAVAGLVLAVSAVLLTLPRGDAELPPMTADEIAVMTSDDELELFEELEFYIWLDDEENV